MCILPSEKIRSEFVLLHPSGQTLSTATDSTAFMHVVDGTRDAEVGSRPSCLGARGTSELSPALYKNSRRWLAYLTSAERPREKGREHLPWVTKSEARRIRHRTQSRACILDVQSLQTAVAGGELPIVNCRCFSASKQEK
jgi:hypothetical protein